MTVAAVLAGTLAPTDPIPLRLAADPGDCLGILPLCDQLNYGAFYSIACRDFLPEVDKAQLGIEVGNRSAYQELFVTGSLSTVCNAWSVPQATPQVAAPLDTIIPTLVLRGWLDPFSAPSDSIRAVVGSAPAVSFIEVPNASYNVQGSNECPRAIRNAWVDAPSTAPADTSCLANMPPIDLAP